MSSLPSILEGSILARPLEQRISGGVTGSLEAAERGSVRGALESGSAGGEAIESPQNSAIAELGGLISSLGSLSAQAQSLPLSPPALPGLPATTNVPSSNDRLRAVRGRLELIAKEQRHGIPPPRSRRARLRAPRQRDRRRSRWRRRRRRRQRRERSDECAPTRKTKPFSSACTPPRFKIRNSSFAGMQSENFFDQMMDERSENMREVDTLRNVDMAQRAKWTTRSPRSSSSRSWNDERSSLPGFCRYSERRAATPRGTARLPRRAGVPARRPPPT